jgi:hypothetical protein
MRYLLSQLGHPGVDPATVDLDLRLPGPATADTGAASRATTDLAR